MLSPLSSQLVARSGRAGDGQEQVRSARVLQTSTCSAIESASSASIPRYLTVLSILVWPSQELHGSQIACAPMISGFGPAERMGTEELRIQPDAGIQSETSREYCRVVMHWPKPLRPANKNSPCPPVCGPEIVVDGFAGLVRQLKL